MSPRKLRAILVPCVLLFLLFIAGILLLNSLIQRPSVQRYLLGRLSQAIGYELSIAKAEISFWRGIGISASDLKAKSRIGPESITAPRARVTFDAGELIKGRIVPTGIFLSRPRIELGLKKGWVSSRPVKGPAFREKFLQRLAGLPSVSLEGAQVYVKDLPFSLEDLSFDACQKGGDPIKVNVSLKGKVVFREQKAPFKLRGTIEQAGQGQGDLVFDMALNAGNVPLSWIPWPGPVPEMTGFAEADVKFTGTLGGHVCAMGKITAQDLGFLLVLSEKRKAYSFPRLAVDFESVFSKSALEISSARVSTPDFSLTASSKLDFQDRSNPFLALMVESPFMPVETFKGIFPTPVVPQWVEKRIFPVFAGGDVRVAPFSLKGSFRQIRDLDLPHNAGVLLMRMVCKNLEVLEHGSTVPFEGVSGVLNIENGALSVSGVKASFGCSVIEDACLNVSSLYSDAPGFHVSMDGSFDLNDLMQQAEMDVIPDHIRASLREFGPVSGNMEASVQVAYECGWDHPVIRTGKFGFSDCSILNKKIVLPVTLNEGGLGIDKEGKSRFQGKGLWGRSEFQVSGSFVDLFENANIELTARADMNEIGDQFYRGLELPVKFSDRVPCRFSLSQKEDIWSCQGEVDLEGVVMDTATFSMDPPGKEDRFVFSIDLHPRERLCLRNLRCCFGKSTFEVTGSYNLRNNDSLDFSVLSDRFLIEDLGIRFKKENVLAKGILLCRAKVNAFLRNPLKTSVKGEMEGQDLSFALSGLASPITDCHFKLGLSGKEILVNSLEMRVGRSPVHISGRFHGWDGLKGKLAVNADYLDLSDIIAKGKKPVAPQPAADSTSREGPNRFIDRSDIDLELNVLNGQWKGLKYGPLKAECKFRSGDIDINRFRVEMEHGFLSMTGRVKTGKDPEMLFSSHIKMTRQPLKEYPQIFGFDKPYVEGLLTGEGIFYVKGRDKHEMVSSLTGSADLLIEEGTIRKSHVILQVLGFLSLQKIFVRKPPELSKKGLYFKSISGTVVINDGILRTDNLTMKSPVFNAAAKGVVNLSRKDVDFDLGIQPLGTIDSLVSKVPIVGYILTGKEKSILMYYFKVTGPLSKPEARYVPLKNLGSSLTGFFERLLFTPARLMKGVSKIK